MPTLHCKLFGCAEREDAPICGRCEAEVPWYSGSVPPSDFVQIDDAKFARFVYFRATWRRKRIRDLVGYWIPRCAQCEKHLVFRKKIDAGWVHGYFCSEKCSKDYCPF